MIAMETIISSLFQTDQWDFENCVGRDLVTVKRFTRCIDVNILMIFDDEGKKLQTSVKIRH